jgi:hypothetical protein
MKRTRGLWFEASLIKKLMRLPSQQISQVWWCCYPSHMEGIGRKIMGPDRSKQKYENLFEK